MSSSAFSRPITNADLGLMDDQLTLLQQILAAPRVGPSFTNDRETSALYAWRVVAENQRKLIAEVKRLRAVEAEAVFHMGGPCDCLETEMETLVP